MCGCNIPYDKKAFEKLSVRDFLGFAGEYLMITHIFCVETDILIVDILEE
jgi:hypothetical protein